MPTKLYAHLDIEDREPFCLPVEVARPEETQFGTLKQAFLKRYGELFPGTSPDYGQCCFWNQDACPIPDRSPLAVFAWEHNDFYLRLLPAGLDGAAGALTESQKKRGELSYYYAHDRSQPQSLIAKPQATRGAGAVASAPPVTREPIKTPDPGTQRFNAKQSPFGTNINDYETMANYTWEDHDDHTVKVLVPLDGVGKLEAAQVKVNFGVRSFELLVDGYQGKNVRFGCYKTHGEMKPEECRHVVRANRVNLILIKAKEKDIWFDLFKKRAIGDDDDP